MTGPSLRRLLALIVFGAVVIRTVRWLRGSPTQAFDPPASPVGQQPGHEPQLATAPVASPPATASAPPAAPAPSPATRPDHVTEPPPWVAPVDGTCPDGYPVKAKLRSGIFHPPGMSAYDRTAPDRCYRDGDAAAADGLRVAKR